MLNAQTISLGTDNEYCPNIEYEFSVTLPGPYSSISATQMLITQQPYAFNSSNTSFKFKAKFNDVNIKQFVDIAYNSNNDHFKPEYKRVKSLFYNNDISCSLIQPKFTSNNAPATSFTAPLCQVSNFNITFNKIKWHTAFENPVYCFGSISDYEYLLPAGWKLGSATSNGTSWLQGTNTATITSDLSTGNGTTIMIRPKNTCITNSANGQIPVQIFINRPNGFTVTPANVPISCGSTTPVTFTVNNINNVTGITNYTWNLGATPNGWLLPNGSPAPATYSTGTANTLTLTPVCGAIQSNVGATVTANGGACIATSSNVSIALPSMNINGANSICSNPVVYSINNLPCNATATWSSNPTGIVSISTSNNQATVTKITDGQTTLKATINACGSQTAIYLTIDAGLPEAPEFIEIYGHGATDPLSLCPGGYRAEAFTSITNQQYQWRLPDEWSSSVSGGNNPFLVGSNGFDIPIQVNTINSYPAFMWVRSKNGCGYSDLVYLEVGTDCYGNRMSSSYTISPNPASTNVQIDGSKNKKLIKEIQLIDKMGQVKRVIKFKSNQTNVNFDVSGFSPDIYYLKIYDGKQWESKQLRIQ